MIATGSTIFLFTGRILEIKIQEYGAGTVSHNLSLSYTMKNGRYNVSFECRNFTDAQLFDNFSLQKAGRAFYGKFRVFFGK